MSSNENPKQTSLLDVINDPLGNFPIYSAKSILRLLIQVIWLVPQLIQRGSTVILVGPAKIGKTTFAMALASAISQGKTFLGHVCTRARVLYINLEGGLASSKYKFELMGIDEDADLFLVTEKPQNSLSFIENLRLLVERTRAEVVIIDSLMLWVGKINENSYSEVYHCIGQLTELSKEKDVTIIFTHHSGKNSESSKDGCLGSTAWFGAPDTKIQLIEKKDCDYLKIDHRNAKSLVAVPLFINHEEGTISLNRPNISEKEQLLREKILSQFTESNSFSVPYKFLKEQVGGNSQTLLNALNNLCAGNILTKIEAETRGGAVTYILQSKPLIAEEV